jgi:hypothetical protein
MYFYFSYVSLIILITENKILQSLSIYDNIELYGIVLPSLSNTTYKFMMMSMEVTFGKVDDVNGSCIRQSSQSKV